MFEILDRQTRLTGNQIKILVAAIIGDALEFFDYFLIGFVLAFLIGPWKLTFGQSAIVLMSSGIGAIIGAMPGAGSPTASAAARSLSAPC
jgi:MFS transporter, putative metabolite:H+ symporter